MAVGIGILDDSARKEGMKMDFGTKYADVIESLKSCQDACPIETQNMVEVPLSLLTKTVSLLASYERDLNYLAEKYSLAINEKMEQKQ